MAILPGAFPQPENMAGHADLNLGSAVAIDALRIQPQAFGEPATCSNQTLLKRIGPVEKSSFIFVSWMIVGLSNAAGAAGYFALLGPDNREFAMNGGALIAIALIAGLLFACRRLGHLPPAGSA